MQLLVALVLSAVLAPAASANPARDLTRAGIPGAVGGAPLRTLLNHTNGLSPGFYAQAYCS